MRADVKQARRKTACKAFAPSRSGSQYVSNESVHDVEENPGWPEVLAGLDNLLRNRCVKHPFRVAQCIVKRTRQLQLVGARQQLIPKSRTRSEMANQAIQVNQVSQRRFEISILKSMSRAVQHHVDGREYVKLCSLQRRCAVHKLRNSERMGPGIVAGSEKRLPHRIIQAESLEQARKAYREFVLK
jgi:hypothetical protein